MRIKIPRGFAASFIVWPVLAVCQLNISGPVYAESAGSPSTGPISAASAGRSDFSGKDNFQSFTAKNQGERIEFYFSASPKKVSFQNGPACAECKTAEFLLIGTGVRYFFTNRVFAQGSGSFLPGSAGAGRGVSLQVFAPIAAEAGAAFDLPWNSQLLFSLGREEIFARMKLEGERIPSASVHLSGWTAGGEVNRFFSKYFGVGLKIAYRSKTKLSLLGERRIQPVTIHLLLIASF